MPTALKNIDSFSKTLSLYDFRHNHQVSELTGKFSVFLNLSTQQVENNKLAGLYHDIGKAMIPSSILNKTESLSKLEFQIIKKHPQYSYSILKSWGFAEPIAKTVLHHHELYDGSGYPDNLVGENIPYDARILCITDNYMALSSSRPYKKAFSKYQTMQIMYKDCNKFDPFLLDAFFDFIDAHSFVVL